MRSTACLVAVLCATLAGVAQETIEWSSERRLKKDDFRGRPPANAASASLSWINIDTEWECEGDELFATARATFDPSRSWWRNSHGNIWGNAGERMTSSRAQREARRSVMQLDQQLLEHEQLHFDIAETNVRRIRERFAEFKNVCADPDGTAPVHAMIARADRELQEEQQRYDRETGHGVNARVQEQWKLRIRALLK
jgi:hypothetical protein